MRANAMVSDIRHTVAQGQKGTGGKDLQVNEDCILASPNSHSPLHSLKLGQQLPVPIKLLSYIRL